MSSYSQAGFDWISKSEARHVCGFEVLLLFESRTVADLAMTVISHILEK